MEAAVINKLPDLSQAVVSDLEFDRNEAWLKQRLGKFTSSNISKLMTYEDKLDDFPKGAMTYVEEIVIEILTNGKGKESFRSDDMDRGNEMELEAVERFEKVTGLKCYQTGDEQQFIELSNYFGGTPDGLIEDHSLIEVKCPKSKTHLFNIRNLKTETDLKKHYSNYYWQIQGNLLATGRNKAYFISYDERFENENHQILIIEINRNDEDIQKLKKRLQMAENKKKELLELN